MVNAKVKFIRFVFIELDNFNLKVLIEINVKYLVIWKIKGSRIRILIQICVTITVNTKNEATY